jgi:hypothetical protein
MGNIRWNPLHMKECSFVPVHEFRINERGLAQYLQLVQIVTFPVYPHKPIYDF